MQINQQKMTTCVSTLVKNIKSCMMMIKRVVHLKNLYMLEEKIFSKENKNYENFHSGLCFEIILANA